MTDWDTFIHKSFVNNEQQVRKRQETSPLRYDKKFID